MRPPFVDLRDNRVQAARAFAEQFNHFEWKYLCSCQWSSAASIKREASRQVSTVTPDGCSHDNAQWFQCFGI